MIRESDVGCGKSTLVQIAAKTMHLRIVSIGSELSGTSQDDLVHQLESLWEMDSISFSTRIPPLILFVWLIG